MTFKL
jgi:hypothetical protein